MLRFFDFILALIGLIVASPLLIILAIAGFFDTGSPIFRQGRVGRHKKPFTLVKFRTMCWRVSICVDILVSLLRPWRGGGAETGFAAVEDEI